jgi:hypothetical protein
MKIELSIAAIGFFYTVAWVTLNIKKGCKDRLTAYDGVVEGKGKKRPAS